MAEIFTPTDASSEATSTLSEDAKRVAEERMIPLELAEMMSQADQLQNEGKLAQAEEAYRDVLNQDPYEPITLNQLGVLKINSGDPEAALTFIRRALASEPDASEYHYNLGVALAQLQRTEEAAAAFDRCLELNPNNAAACNNLGAMLMLHEQTEAATAAFLTAIKLNPQDAGAYSNLGRLLAQTGNHEDAATMLEQAINLNPTDPNAWQILADMQAAHGQQQDADSNQAVAQSLTSAAEQPSH
ncbi:tetratricopeptide repeat protein [Rhabdochromatium marinum]|uniref:tetratricopeptide repeat protein n=1 Tax=Rhabdochromatium marinum TaxID=48729 RepID=UPI001906437C|nr:tetratricopeptide repeat protein [Rhabdochromatium marinum]MBK1648485.1 hypothetical protein [Rhabdochromatium marinum]